MPKEPKMTKFGGNRSYTEIKALCKANGLTVDDTAYREQFMDSITVIGGGAKVVYNTFNGRFSGVTPDGKHFFSSSTKYENEPWFQALLVFFYKPLPAAEKEPRAPGKKAVFK